MPPKKVVKKKKKAAEAKAPPFPIPRDLSEIAPLDAHDGVLGIEHSDVTARVKAAKTDLVLWKLSEAVRNGDLDIDLSDSGLDELPEEAFDLPWLQVVDLSKNRFVNEVIDDLKALTSIRGLDLATNVLHGPLPESLGALSASLEELRLDENVITSIPESAAALTQLTWFSIRKNLLSTMPASCLMSWTRLEYLDLRHNKLKEVPEELSYCVSLRSLFLSNNELTALTASVGALTALEVLHIQKNALTELPSTIASCAALVDLDASFNKITELPRALLASALGLERVVFASNKLTTVPPEIGLLHRLQVLSLAGNGISSLPEEIGALTKLREIYLNGNPLSALPPSVAGWGAVEEASFKGCKLKALPRLAHELPRVLTFRLLNLVECSEVSTAWTKVQVVDVRAKKKDTCKIAPEFKDAPAMRKVHMLGVVLAKAKKKKATKK